MKKLTFKQWYSIIVLLVAIVYGWLYLMEHRYVPIGYDGGMFDTWKWEYAVPADLLPGLPGE